MAYSTRSTDLGEIQGLVDELARRMGSPAAGPDRAQIARSIHRYMLGGRTRSRAMDRELKPRRDPVIDGGTKRDMQVQAGRHSAVQVKAANLEKIRTAITTLQANGRKATQAAVAAMTGLSIATVERRWAEARAINIPSSIPILLLPGNGSSTAAPDSSGSPVATAARVEAFGSFPATRAEASSCSPSCRPMTVSKPIAI